MRKVTATPDPFFDQASGLIHIGAHHAEERFAYAKRRLKVLWIEADPHQIPILRTNLRGFPRQACLQALLGSRAESEREFYIANNAGASSSVYPLAECHLIWPEVKMEGVIRLPQLTLPEAMAKARLSLQGFDTLVMDVQGSELEILKGIPNLQNHFQRIQLETSDFPVYQKAPLKAQIDRHLKSCGYRLAESMIFASGGQTRNCMDCRYVLED